MVGACDNEGDGSGESCIYGCSDDDEVDGTT